MIRSVRLLRPLSILICLSVLLPLCLSVSAFAKTARVPETIREVRSMTVKEAESYAVQSYRYPDEMDFSVSSRYGDQLTTEDQLFFYDAFLSAGFSADPISREAAGFQPIPVSEYQKDTSAWGQRILSYAADQIVPAYAAFGLDRPDIAFWTARIQYGYALSGFYDGDVLSYKVTLSAQIIKAVEYEDEDLKTMSESIRSRVQELSGIDSPAAAGSLYDTVKSLHDNLCGALVYNLNGTYAHSAYSIVTGEAVCEGYAKGMKLLCDRYQIPCMIVTGTGVTRTGSEGHAWNVIRMENGKWYGLDATWDDQSTVYYDFFLVGSKTVPEHFNKLAFEDSHIEEEDWNGNQSVFLQHPTLNESRFDPETDIHQFGEWILEVPAGCTEPGVKGHYHCSHCNVDFDQNHQPLDSLAIPAKGHSFTARYTTKEYLVSPADCENAAVYCFSCVRCGEPGKDTFVSGEPLGHTGGTATCHSLAVCDRCNQEYGQFDPSNHEGKTELRNQKDATCEEAGSTGDLYCTACDAVLTPGRVLQPLGHTGGTATCHTLAVCDRCKQEYGQFDPSNHDGETELRNQTNPTCDEAGSTGDLCCTGCDTVLTPGQILQPLGHTGGTATCHTLAVCDRCKQNYGEYNPSNHDGETELRNQKDATCEETGWTGDLCCTGCDAVLKEGESIQPLGHLYDPEDESKQVHYFADCTHPAYDVLICVRCGKESEEKREYGEPLGHQYESVYTPPTSTSNGYTTFTCSRCSDSYVVYDDPDTTLKGTVGDINLDGEINAIDYILLKKYVLQTIDLTERQLAVADINGNGDIDAVDYILLKKKILNGD